MSGVFSTPNDRVFYSCHGVWYKSRTTTQSGGNDSITGSTFLQGVQSAGVSKNTGERTTFFDNGRMNQVYGSYGKTSFEINISRAVGKSQNFFYNVTSAGGGSSQQRYERGHILSTKTSHTIGNCGASNRLKNYDITLVLAPDDVNYIGETSIREGGSIQTKTYRCCLLTSVSYDIPISGPVIENLTFTTGVYTQNDITNISGLPAGPPNTDEVITRKDIRTSLCEFPLEVERMFDLGTSLGGIPILGLQNINIGININYNQLLDYGDWRGSGSDRAEQNLYTYVELPVDITASFSGVVRAQYHTQASQDQEMIDIYHTAADGTESGVDNYKADRSILIVADGLSGNLFQWNLGDKNFLTSMSTNGGDTSGGNMEGELSFTNTCSDVFLLKGSNVLDFSNTNIY